MLLFQPFDIVKHFRQKFVKLLDLHVVWDGSFFRSNQKTISYLDRFLNTREIKGSDQKNFNQFLLHNQPTTQPHRFGDRLIIDNVVDQDYNYNKLSLLALNKPLVKRGPIEDDTYVWHPNTRKEAQHKKQSFIDRKKWLL